MGEFFCLLIVFACLHDYPGPPGRDGQTSDSNDNDDAKGDPFDIGSRK